jgi:hypothetical protein
MEYARQPGTVASRLYRAMRPDLVENSAERSAVDSNAGRDTRALQAYLGHSNIQHTVRYTELSSDRFKGHEPCFR